MEASIRAFVAVVPPKDVLEYAAAFVARLRALAPYKWVEGAQLHLTLRFLGSAPEEQVAGVANALGKVTGKTFDVRLDRAGGFPNLTCPRALWLGGADPAGTEALSALAARVESAARESGYGAETKSFIPHLTIARAKNPAPLPPPLTKALSTPPVLSWRCDRFFLIQSRLTPSGPLYVPLREYPLAGKPFVGES